MSNILAVFVPDSFDFRMSEVLSALGFTDGVEVSNVSFSLDGHADSPLTISMVLEGIHELPLLMQKVKDQTEISAEIDFYDRAPRKIRTIP